MRPFMNTMIVLATLLVLAQPVAGGDDDYAHVTVDAYPGQCAVVLNHERSHRFEPYVDLIRTFQYGIFTRTYYEEKMTVKILTEEGLDRYGNFASKIINKEYHDYDVKGRIILPNGKKKNFKKNNMKELAVGRRYIQHRYAFPALEIGSIIEIEEKIKIDAAQLSGEWDFAADVPTLRSTFTFMVPKDTEVKLFMTPKEDLAQITPEKDGKYHVFTIEKENIDPYLDEPFMSPDHIGNPTLRYYVRRLPNYVLESFLDLNQGTLQGDPYRMFWPNIGDAYAAYFNCSSWKEEDKTEKCREELAKTLAGIDLSEASDLEARLYHILEFFHREFQPVEDKWLYATKNPEECFEIKEGGPFELAYALKSIIEHYELPVDVVLTRDLPDGLLDRRTPTYDAFTHALLFVKHNDEEYWIDPFNHHCSVNQLPWECQGVEAFSLSSTGKYAFKNLPIDAAGKNCIKNTCTAKLEESGDLAGRVTMVISGQYLLMLRESINVDSKGDFEKNLKELIEKNFPQSLGSGGMNIVEEKDDELVVTFDYTVPEFAESVGDFVNIDFSAWFKNDLSEVFSGDTRAYDIHIPFPRGNLTKVEIALPDGMVIHEIPQERAIENEWLAYRRSVIGSENSVTFTRNFFVTAPKIPVEKYSGMKESVVEIYNLDREALVLKRGEG